MNSAIILFSLLVVCASAGHHHGYGRQDNKFGGFKGHGSHGSGHGSHGVQVTDKSIEDTVKAILNPQSTAPLVQFLTCLNSTDGQAALKALGINSTVVPQLLKLLQGSPDDVAAAKSQIKNLVQSLSGSNFKRKYSKVRRVFEVYQLCMGRLTAQQQIQQATTENLKKMLTALAAAEQNYGFRRINFADLLQILTNNGEQGKQEVTQKLSAWVNVATVEDLTKTAMIAYKLFSGQFTPMSPSNTTTTLQPNTPTNSTQPSQTVTPTPSQNQTVSQPPAANSTTTPPRPEPFRAVKPKPIKHAG